MSSGALKLFFGFAYLFLAIWLDGISMGFLPIVRAINVDGQHYGVLDHFCHATSWCLNGIRKQWHSIAAHFAPIFSVNNDNAVFMMDHTKKPKEGRRMPGVQKLAHDSDTQSKRECICR